MSLHSPECQFKVKNGNNVVVGFLKGLALGDGSGPVGFVFLSNLNVLKITRSKP